MYSYSFYAILSPHLLCLSHTLCNMFFPPQAHCGALLQLEFLGFNGAHNCRIQPCNVVMVSLLSFYIDQYNSDSCVIILYIVFKD